MSQYITGTVAVVNGDATVTGTGTTWSTELAAGDGFTIVDSGVTYTVASITDDTHLELSSTYAGATDSGLSYVIYRDFTSPDSIPELNKGDIETSTIWTRAVRKIQDLIVQATNTSDTAIATTSGTSHGFTGIPSWATQITLSLSGVSTNGTSNLLVQIGPVAGVEITSYSSVALYGTSSSASTIGFILTQINSASTTSSGSITISLIDSATNTWASSGNIGISHSTGSKALAGALSTLRLTTVGGTDTFDAGLINITYN